VQEILVNLTFAETPTHTDQQHGLLPSHAYRVRLRPLIPQLGATIVNFSASAIGLLLLLAAAGHTARNETENAVQAYVDLGPVRLVAGMPRDQAIALLAESYSISPWKNPEGKDAWGVADRRADEHGNGLLVAFVFFEAGRLVRAGKYWPQSNSGYDVVHTISNALDHLREQGFSKCSVFSRKENEPDMEHDILSINCGAKGITLDASLSHYQGEPVTGVQVYEEIAYVPARKR
jgi:hypothetical protein